VVVLNFPESQNVQSSSPELEEYMPAEQSTHASWRTNNWNLPAGQSSHELSLLKDALNFPSVHLLQSVPRVLP